MRAFQWNFRRQHHFLLLSPAPEQHRAFMHECSLLHLPLAAEPEHLRASAPGHLHASGIIRIQNRKIFRVLVFKQPRLRVHISLKCPMPVEMIGRNVEHNPNLRPETANGFELEAGNFQHNDRLRRRSFHQRNRRRPNVPADQRLESARCENLSNQRSGCSLPVRSRNADNRPRQKRRCQFNLSDDRLSQRPRLRDGCRIHGNPRADNDQVLILKCPLAMPAGFNCDPLVKQRRNFLAKLLFRLGVGNRDPRAARLQKQRRSHARAPQSHHQHAFSVEFH